MRMASSIPGELIPSASVWHAPGITPCVKTPALASGVENYSPRGPAEASRHRKMLRCIVRRRAERF